MLNEAEYAHMVRETVPPPMVVDSNMDEDCMDDSAARR